MFELICQIDPFKDPSLLMPSAIIAAGGAAFVTGWTWVKKETRAAIAEVETRLNAQYAKEIAALTKRIDEQDRKLLTFENGHVRAGRRLVTVLDLIPKTDDLKPARDEIYKTLDDLNGIHRFDS